MLDDFRPLSVKGNLRGWIHKDLSIEALKLFLDHPERFLNAPDSQILRDNPKTKVVKQALESPDGVKHHVVIKRFTYPSIWRRLGFIFHSRPALRSFKGSLLLIEHGIGTACPLAILDPGGLKGGGTSYYITAEIKDGQTLDAFWAYTLSIRTRRENLRERLQVLNEIASLFYRLHSYGIYHADLKGANIVIRNKGKNSWHCFLVDVGDVRKRKRLRWSRRIKNLVQLLRTFGRHLNARERVYLINRYADLFSIGRDRRRALLTKVLSESRGEV